VTAISTSVISVIVYVTETSTETYFSTGLIVEDYTSTLIDTAGSYTYTTTNYVTITSVVSAPAQSCSATTVTISNPASSASGSATATADLCQSSANVIQNGNFYQPGQDGNLIFPWTFTAPFNNNVEPYVTIYETPDNSANSL
jgi:hypothetical protein